MEDPGVTLRLEFGEAVRDQFVIPENSEIREVEVVGWHGTLRSGFESAFSGNAEWVPTGGEWVVVLKNVKLDFVPDAIYEGGGAAAVRARLRYLGRMITSAEKAVRLRLSGEIISEGVWTQSGGEITTSVEVVEKMYQQIAAEEIRRRLCVLIGAKNSQ